MLAAVVVVFVAGPAAAADGGVDAAQGADGGAQERGTPPGPAGPPVRAPVPLAPVTPAYPEAAMKAGTEGDIALILTIDDTGLVTDVEVEAGLPDGLTESAVAA